MKTSRRMFNFRLPLIGSVVHKIREGLFVLASRLPGGRVLRETRDTQVPVTSEHWFAQRILGINGGAYWPMHPSSRVSYAKRIRVGIETSPGWAPACYIHGENGIYIGDYTQIAPGVGIISGDHNFYDLSLQMPSRPIRIGKYCLLGMHATVLPGVELGDYTIVGANSVVTKSFPEGFVVLAGNPAEVVRRLDPAQRKDYQSRHRYHGYIAAEDFAAFERRWLELK